MKKKHLEHFFSLKTKIDCALMKGKMIKVQQNTTPRQNDGIIRSGEEKKYLMDLIGQLSAKESFSEQG